MTSYASLENLIHSPPPPEQPRVLTVIHDHHEQAKSDEQVYMEGFYGYCQNELGINPTSMAPEDKPVVTKAAHEFISKAIDRNIQRTTAQKEDYVAKGGDPDNAPKPPFKVPFGQVEDGIDQYYREFGVHRRTKSPPVAEKELTFLEENLLPTHIKFSKGSLSTNGTVDVKRTSSRPLDFLELFYTAQLQAIVTKHGDTLAADSLETLLAAYGNWFPKRLRTVGQQMARTTAQGYRHAYVIDENTIPDEYKAEGQH